MPRGNEPEDPLEGFHTLQASLGRAVAQNRPGQDRPHVVVKLPSLSLGEAVLARYGPQLPALERRHLAAFLMLHRIPNCETIHVSTLAPSEEVLDYMAALVPEERRRGSSSTPRRGWAWRS